MNFRAAQEGDGSIYPEKYAILHCVNSLMNIIVFLYLSRDELLLCPSFLALILDMDALVMR